jgi:predicted phage terminase large subunit-like protein
MECAKDLDLFVQPDNRQKVSNIEKEQERVAEENEEAFNKQAEAKKELAERALSRRRLLPFIKRVNPDYIPGWVHADICERLERFAIAIENGESPRLMITMPPRHGKSEIGSKTFPSWYLGRNPKHEVMVCSYSGDLAKDFSRKCRDLLENPKYQSMFKTRLSKDSKSVERWNTSAQGAFTAAGVGGPITGRGCSLGIIDDPVKNREEAESETTRQNVKDWYSSAFYTRLAPGGGILVIQTRWHDDDLSGWLLNTLDEAKKEAVEAGSPLDPSVDNWELVEYPAIATHDEKYRLKGDALHADRYPIEALNKIKRNMIPRDWEALYQQKPVSDDGDYFTKSMFKYYKPGDSPPLNEMRIYAAADLAISTKQTADYTVFTVVGIDREQNIWIIDVIRGRWNALGLIDRLFGIQEKYNPELFGIETGQIELTLEPFIMKAEQERGLSLRYEKLRTRGVDKGTRARPIQGRMEQGKVYFPTVESVPWMSSLQNELLKFPLGKNDDQVDSLSWIGQMIMLFGIRNEKKVKPKKSWKDKLKQYGGGNNGKHKSGMAA